jgi:hypothetical protein
MAQLSPLKPRAEAVEPGFIKLKSVQYINHSSEKKLSAEFLSIIFKSSQQRCCLDPLKALTTYF